jgi:hypothetical protein
MTSLSHEQVREFIQQGHLAEEDRPALQQHLSSCDECRAYAAMHVLLWRDLPLRTPRKMPTAAQRETILSTANSRRISPPFWRPLSALGGVAAVLFLALAFWFVLRAASPFASQPVLPAPLATMLAPLLDHGTPTPPADPVTTPTPRLTPEATPDPRGRIITDTVPAPSLAGNIIGEPLEQKVAIYLPPSYDSSDRRYPVVYALTDDYRVYSEPPELLDQMARTGMTLALRDSGQEMIVVMPNDINALNLYNLYVNSPVSGDRESYIANDLVAFIDANYRTLPAAGSRGLFSEDWNGLNTLSIAMRHPDVFGAVYLHQPIVFPPGALNEESRPFSATDRNGVLALMEEFSGLSAAEGAARMREWFAPGKPFLEVQVDAASYGIAYAPSIEAGAPFFEYPYSEEDGAPDPEIWRKWENGFGDIPQRLEPYRDALGTLKLAVSSGDPSGVGATYLSEQLTAMGITHAFSQPDTSALEELGNAVFPFFSEALDFE